MLVTHDQDRRDRIWVTRFATVGTYFTANDDGDGVILHVEPGFTAYTPQFEAIKDDVREAVIAEIAGRLNIAPDDVFRQSMAALRAVADPDLPSEYRYARRSKNRSYPRQF